MRRYYLTIPRLGRSLNFKGKIITNEHNCKDVVLLCARDVVGIMLFSNYLQETTFKKLTEPCRTPPDFIISNQAFITRRIHQNLVLISFYESINSEFR